MKCSKEKNKINEEVEKAKKQQLHITDHAEKVKRKILFKLKKFLESLEKKYKEKEKTKLGKFRNALKVLKQKKEKVNSTKNYKEIDLIMESEELSKFSLEDIIKKEKEKQQKLQLLENQQKSETRKKC